MRLRRRTFLGSIAAAATCLRVPTSDAGADRPRFPVAGEHGRLVDTNVSLGAWPLRRLPLDSTDRLARRLAEHGVASAWAASFEALLHKDLAGANLRLAEACRRRGRPRLIPFGSINPLAPDWEEELRRCAENHLMPGIRLFPNYHGYRLDHPDFARLLDMTARRGLLAQVALVMEDERMMHPLLRVEPVDTAPLVELVRRTPGLRLHLVNALRTLRAKPLLDLVATGRVSVEIAMLEGIGGLDSLLRQVPVDRVTFGSHAPLFYFEAAALKLHESELTPARLASIRTDNAVRLLAAP